MNQRYAKVEIRNIGQKKVIISSKIKPEITSSIVQKWQSLIDVAAKIVKVPSGLIMKLNEETIEVFVKSNTEGNPYKAGEEAKLNYGLYCETVIGTQKQLLVPDATKSKVWNKNNPDVDINMISYLGLPINWPDGEVFGTVCLLDNKENHYSSDYIEFLNQVKTQIETDLQLLVAHQQLTDRNRELKNTIESSETLKSGDKRFRIIFENSLAVMLLIDLDSSRIVAANKAAEKFYGWKRSEIEKMRVSDINTLSPSEIADELKKARKSERNYFRFKHSLASGEIRDVEIYSSKVEIEGKDYLHSIIHDVTEQLKAEEALFHSHELMKYIIEHNKSAVAVHDKNLNYVYVSQRYLNDYRITDKNIIGKHHYEVFPDLPEKWRKVHRKALRGIVSRADDDIFYREDGTVDWTRWECRPWYEADGSIGGIIIYTEVINEQKRKEEEIRKLNQRLGILIESIQQLSSAQSLDSVQDIVAKSARKLIGADGATLVLKENNQCFYVNEDAIEPLWKGKKFPMNSCISGWVMENKKSVVIENIYADERIPKAVYNPTFIKSLAMVPVNTSEPIGAIGNYWKETCTPTETEMQLLQTLADAAARSIENINLYAELEERVKKRTEQLQAANKELETFTYSVSHDLKAPLRGIDGYSKLLMDDYGNSLNEEASHFIKTIRSSTLQMNQLIDDLLSYSRLERSEVKQEKIKLKSFVERIVSGFSDELQKSGATIKMHLPEIQITADSTGLSIALRNFVENALKFSSEKPLIEIGYEENPGSWIIFVKDNGVGFDMKYHDRIFDIFQRLHRAEDFPGTGIGLAMVAKAMQRMGGKTWAESSPGNGATFFIELPKNL